MEKLLENLRKNKKDSRPEAIDDILVKYGVISDDDYKTIVSHDGSRVYVDRDNPRTEIYIRELDDEQWV